MQELVLQVTFFCYLDDYRCAYTQHQLLFEDAGGLPEREFGELCEGDGAAAARGYACGVRPRPEGHRTDVGVRGSEPLPGVEPQEGRRRLGARHQRARHDVTGGDLVHAARDRARLGELHHTNVQRFQARGQIPADHADQQGLQTVPMGEVHHSEQQLRVPTVTQARPCRHTPCPRGPPPRPVILRD